MVTKKRERFIERHVWKLGQGLTQYDGEYYAVSPATASQQAQLAAGVEGYRVVSCQEIPSKSEHYWTFKIQVELAYLGTPVPDCASCAEIAAAAAMGQTPFEPSHYPSAHCESGSRPHCSCPICWG
jgi:hypothetical protein